jgi:hypothetical protein
LALDAILSEQAYEFLDNLSPADRALWDELKDDFIARPVREGNTVDLRTWEPDEKVTAIGPFLILFRFENEQVLQVFRIMWFR